MNNLLHIVEDIKLVESLIITDPLVTPVLTFLSIIVVFYVYDDAERYCPHKNVEGAVRGAGKSPGPSPRATI